MISAKFLWGNVLLGGKLQIGAKNSNFDIFESALCMKSVSMPLIKLIKICIQILEVFKTKKDDFIYNRYYLSTIYFLQFGSIHEERKEGAMHTQLSKI